MRLLLAFAALLFVLPAHAVTIDWVTVGDPGNAADHTTGYGAVADVYFISKHETTNAQYAEFLNDVAATDPSGLYNPNMGSGFGGITRSGSSGSYTYSAIAGRESMPVNYVSFYDALRFANWLHNGQPPGAQDSTTTEDGAYTFSGPTSVGARNAGATIFLPSEDEWYKAAYYDALSASYFDYPAGSNTQTACMVPGVTRNTANCDLVVGDLTDVGSYTESSSPNGTFDQGGNVWEWNEAIIGSSRGLRGGSFEYSSSNLAAWSRGTGPPFDFYHSGFRVASIPESNAACSDTVDNDGDGLIDLDDPDCTDENDPLEAPDADQDLVEDDLDNCVELANPGQQDTDGDDYGNVCDCDFDQSLTCGIADFNIFLPDFQSTVDSGVGSDMDSSGTIGIDDFNLFLPGFVAGEPGPSGLVP